MTEAAPLRASRPRSPKVHILIVGVLGLLALLAIRAERILPVGFWLEALAAPSSDDPAELLFHHSFLPRVAIALVAGSALGLAGAVFQQILRNPLAEPATLGVSAGAQLAMSLTLLWAPSLFATLQGGVVLAGGGVALALVMALASASSFSVTTLVIAGLIVNLVCGSLSTMLILSAHEFTTSISVWSSGSLAQNGWRPVCELLSETGCLSLFCGLIARPLEVMGLEERSASGLGVPVNLVRGVALGLAAALGACVTSAVGVIGFIGLAAPGLARSLGAARCGKGSCGRPCLAPLCWRSPISSRK